MKETDNRSQKFYFFVSVFFLISGISFVFNIYIIFFIPSNLDTFYNELVQSTELTQYLLTRGHKNFRQETMIDGKEIDFITEKLTPFETKTNTYIFELKETDIDKVISQAIKRKHLCDYIYIVMVRTPLSYFCYKLSQNLKRIRDHGIGVHYYYNDDFHEVVMPNKKRRD